MYSTGHIIFIIISFLMITLGVFICKKNKWSTDDVIKACFFIALTCEIVKIFSVIKILPMVQPVIENGEIVYKETGEYHPFIQTIHLPFELCSLQILFMPLYLAIKNKKWKRRIYSLIYGTALLGGILATFVSSIAGDYATTKEFLLSLRAWEFYIYHSMLMVIAILIATDKTYKLRFSDAKWTCIIVFLLDIIAFYINSMLSTPVYRNGELIGLSNSVNFFSSYSHPLGIEFRNKGQYLLYLLSRYAFVATFIIIIYLPFLKKTKENE